MNDSPKCPLNYAVDKDQCSVADLSVRGMLQTNELIVDAWNDKPSGCFPIEMDNVMHFNNNPILGSKGHTYISVCKKIEVRYNSILLDQLHQTLLVL